MKKFNDTVRRALQTYYDAETLDAWYRDTNGFAEDMTANYSGTFKDRLRDLPNLNPGDITTLRVIAGTRGLGRLPEPVPGQVMAEKKHWTDPIIGRRVMYKYKLVEGQSPGVALADSPVEIVAVIAWSDLSWDER